MRHQPDRFFLWFIIVAIIMIPFALWMHLAGPCEMYKISVTGDIPARCLSHYTK